MKNSNLSVCAGRDNQSSLKLNRKPQTIIDTETLKVFIYFYNQRLEFKSQNIRQLSSKC